MVTLREIVMIHDLRRQGLGISAIARQTGLGRKTDRKYLSRGWSPLDTVPCSHSPGCAVRTRAICASESPLIAGCPVNSCDGISPVSAVGADSPE